MPNSSSVDRIVAVIGLAGSGKSTAVRIISERLDNAPVVYFGGVVIDELRARGLPLDESNERQVRESLRAAQGMGAIALAAAPRIREAASASQFILLDGLYSSAEVEALDEAFPGALVTVAIHASRAVREERMGKRLVRPLTPQELLSRDRSEIRLLDKAEPIAMADIHVINNGTEEDLAAALSLALSPNSALWRGKFTGRH